MSNPNALAEKEKGNQFFKEKNYESAVNCYSKAIEYDRTNHLLYGNRSQAYLNLNRPDEAVKDCNQAIKLDSNYVKGYLRRGTALKMLSDYEKALTDFKKVLQLEPNNKQALKEVQDINELLSPKKAGLIQPISSNDTFYSNNKQIETLPSGDEKQSNRLNVRPSSKKSLPMSNRVINRVPINTFEFYCDWRELSTDSTKLNYITNIGVTKMREIFRDSMEPFVFCDLLRILASCEDIPFRSSMLLELSKIEKFATLVLFLEKHEEKYLRDLIVDMKSCLSEDDMNTFIGRIGKKYVL